MPTTSPKLTKRAEHLLGEIKSGRDRIFAADERPPGWLQLERSGLARRHGDHAVLTIKGDHAIKDRGF